MLWLKLLFSKERSRINYLLIIYMLNYMLKYLEITIYKQTHSPSLLTSYIPSIIFTINNNNNIKIIKYFQEYSEYNPHKNKSKQIILIYFLFSLYKQIKTKQYFFLFYFILNACD